jgi:hypothetical protein
MGELLDALNALDDNGPAPKPINPIDQVALAFRSAGQRVSETIEALKEPGMPLEKVARLTRQAPLQALAAALLIGVLFTRRR